MNPKINSYPNINKTAHLSTEELFGMYTVHHTFVLPDTHYMYSCTEWNGNKNKNSRLMMQPNLLFKTKFVYMINKENKSIYV